MPVARGATAKIGAGTPATRIEMPPSSVGSGEPLPIIGPESVRPRRNKLAKPPGSGNPGAYDAALTMAFAGTSSGEAPGPILTTPTLPPVGSFTPMFTPVAYTLPAESSATASTDPEPRPVDQTSAVPLGFSTLRNPPEAHWYSPSGRELLGS